MKERIYTIPLTEVVAPGVGCPFCLLAARAEGALLRLYLEGMLVDVEWRGRILRDWLCPRHLAGLQMEGRKLGGAIIVQALLQAALAELGHENGAASLPAWGTSCLACQDIGRAVCQHAEAYIHTWIAEAEFRTLAAKADPFCLPHLSLLHREAGRLPGRQRDPLRAELLRFEEAALRPLLGEVDWFIKKFDVRFREAPWQGAEDAVERAVAILAGERP